MPSNNQTIFGAFAAITLLLSASAGAATIAVTNSNDAFAVSLRQAIQDASPGDTIVFQIPKSDAGYDSLSGFTTISLNSRTLVITKELRSTQEAGILATTIPPNDDFESAIVATLSAGSFVTAIVRGQKNATGIALIEIYALS